MNKQLIQRCIDIAQSVLDNQNVSFAYDDRQETDAVFEHIAELKAELEKPEPVPVGWLISNHPHSQDFVNLTDKWNAYLLSIGCKITEIYTSPPAREPLTEDEAGEIFVNGCKSDDWFDLVRAIEKHHGIGVDNE